MLLMFPVKCLVPRYTVIYVVNIVVMWSKDSPHAKPLVVFVIDDYVENILAMS